MRAFYLFSPILFCLIACSSGDALRPGPVCGDGLVQSGEECDAGAANADSTPDVCRTNCKAAHCGDGTLDVGETCDNGGGNSDAVADACRGTCVEPRCGDGVTDSGEGCDEGGANSDTAPDGCRSGCALFFCGDGVIDSGEQCDDGNAENNDPCANSCRMRGRKLVAGSAHNCLLWDGFLYCWGENGHGQVGNGISGTGMKQAVPVLIQAELSAKNVTDVDAGHSHTCAIADGTLYCWGDNYFGPTGQGTTLGTTDSPGIVGGLLAGKTVTQVSLGNAHTCAIADGALYCWGSSDSGRLGNGVNDSVNVSRPLLVGGALTGKTVTQVTLGGHHTCAIADGALYCWGWNEYGQVGDSTGGELVCVTTPVRVGGLLDGKTIHAVELGSTMTCALTAAGELYCWGLRLNGQLGDGSTVDYQVVPLKLSGGIFDAPVDGVHLATSWGTHGCVVAGGSLHCWGNNADGQVGTGAVSANVLQPAEVAGLLSSKHVQQAALGQSHTCVLANDQLFCWGNNGYSQLGDGGTTASLLPEQITW